MKESKKSKKSSPDKWEYKITFPDEVGVSAITHTFKMDDWFDIDQIPAKKRKDREKKISRIFNDKKEIRENKKS